MGRTRRTVVITWIWSFLACTPSLFSKTTRDFNVAGDQWTTCNDAWPSSEAALGYTIYVTVILFGFPTLALGICYTLIVFRLYSSKRITKHMRPLSVVNMPVSRADHGEGGTVGNSRGAEGSTSDDGVERVAQGCPKRHRRQKHDAEDDSIKRIVIMLILVVVVFILCWGPFFCYALLLRADLIKIRNYDTAWKLSLTLHLLAYGNSCINPFIYAFMSKSFREGFVTACRSCQDQKGSMKRRGQMQSYGSGYNTRIATLTTNTTRRV